MGRNIVRAGLLLTTLLFFVPARSCEHMQGSGADIPLFPGGSNIFINNYGAIYFIISPGPVHLVAPAGGVAAHPVASPAPASYPAPYAPHYTPPPYAPYYSGGTKPPGPYRWQWMNNCHHCFHSFINNMRSYALRAPSLYAYVKENRWALAAKGTIGFYILLNYALFRKANFLTAPQRWMYWRSEILLVQLMRMSSTDVIQELLASLSLRTQLPPDQSPIQLLFTELDDEICQLQQYTRWVDTINKFSYLQNYCATSAETVLPSFMGIPLGSLTRVALSAVSLKNICYIDYELLQHTPEYLRRLMYLRRILEEELAVDLPQVIAETAESERATKPEPSIRARLPH